MNKQWIVLLAGLFAHGALVAVEYKDQVSDYTVVAGDTIQGITRHTLGADTFWQANWALNPAVANPNVLRIGQILRIITAREIIAERARVELATNEIEKQLKAKPWAPATVGDQIGDGEAIRTRAKSTAVLRFNANSMLRLGEFSQVFLAKKETTLAGVDRGSVEVTEGDVDVVFEKLSSAKTDIEIISGTSSVRAAADALGSGAVRAGKLSGGGARVMVFSGVSEVKAAGAAVRVGAGMGTTVPQSGPPHAPEKLLGAPLFRDASLRWNYNNGRIYWQPVEKAASYTLELCQDRQCSALAWRKTGIKLPTDAIPMWQLNDLPAASYFVRVLAQSASGLDGYPSRLMPLVIEQGEPDTLAPMLTLQPKSGFFTSASGALLAGPQARALIFAHDEQSGLAQLRYRFNSGELQMLATAQPAEIALESGFLEVSAVDQLGQEQRMQYQIGAALLTPPPE
jgi:hypothetical protein